MALVLKQTDKAYVVVKEGLNKVLVVHKTAVVGADSVNVELADAMPQGTVTSSTECYGVFGVYYLLSGPHLAVVTKVASAAKAPGSSSGLQSIKALQFLPLTTGSLPPAAAADDALYLDMLHSVVARGAFFFSNTWDMTNTLQRQAGFAAGGVAAPGTPAVDPAAPVAPELQVARADPRFWWNAHLCGELTAVGAAPFLVVAICGFVEACIAQKVGEERVDVYLMSRRSNRRQGTRFNVRGIDACGNVANFVETEQLLVWKDGRMASFVQTRGSIPLVWSQAVNLRYNPKCLLGSNPAQTQVLFQRHLSEQGAKYGSVISVNLIDTKGDQNMLGAAFAEAAKRAEGVDLTYVWFDFHKECKNMKWGNLSKLLGKVAGGLEGQGVFAQGPAGVTAIQTGVVRTNCMDNLDRTNVVQSLFARWAVLFAATGASSAASGGDVLSSPFASFERVFKGQWADHADAMSKLYSGTGALKTDFTRTGKRTLAGAAADGTNSVQRYVYANFQDGRTQDAWDLFLGRFVPVWGSGGEPRMVTGWGGSAGDTTHPSPPVVVRHKEGAPSPLAPVRADITPGAVGTNMALLFATLVAVGALVAHTALDTPATGAGVSSASGLWGLAAPGTLPDTWVASLGWGVGGASLVLGGLFYAFTKVGLGAGFGIVSAPHFVHHDMVSAPRQSRQVFGSDAAKGPGGNKGSKLA